MTGAIAALLALVAAAAPPAPAAGADAALVQAFRAECAARAKAASDAGMMTVAGADGWLFFQGELRHVGAGEFWGEAAAKVSRAARDPDPLPAILDYKAQLDKLGIEMILLPVPPKAIIYPDKLCAKVKPDAKGIPARLDTAHQAFYRLLRDKGVRVLDLTDEFLAARADPGAAPMFCKQDTHWSGLACVLAARKIAETVKGRPWVAGLPRKTYDTETAAVQIAGDLWRDLKGAKPPQETLRLRFVGTKGAVGLTPVEPDPNSPVLLLADSHGLVFHMGGDMHAAGAGLPDQLVAELGCPIERVAVKGSGATPARISLYRKQRQLGPGYLKAKKLLIWCFAARELTESDGWRMVPVTRK
jgi:alginate O-acetyltransferase complex protein AlgJ